MLDALFICRRCFIDHAWSMHCLFAVDVSLNTYFIHDGPICSLFKLYYASYIWYFDFLPTPFATFNFFLCILYLNILFHSASNDLFQVASLSLAGKKVILKFCNSCRPTTANIIENYLCRWFFYANFARFFRPAILLNTTYKQWEALWIKFTGLN